MNTQKKARSLYWDIVKGGALLRSCWGIPDISPVRSSICSTWRCFSLSQAIFIMKRNTGIRRFFTSAPVSPVHGPGICSTRCFLSCSTTFL